MANIVWIGTTADHNVGANWVGGSVPGVGDNAQFTAANVNPCTLSAPWSVGGIEMQAGFQEKIDLNDHDVTITPGDSVILDGTGGAAEFDMGDGKLSLDGGTFDNQTVTLFTRESSELSMSGVGTIIGKNGNDLHNLTIESDATIAIDAATDGRVVVFTGLNVSGRLILNEQLRVQSNCDITLNATATVEGASLFVISNPANGHGLVTFTAGAILTAPIQIIAPRPGSRLAAGTYGGHVKISGAAAERKLELDFGSYVFSSFELEYDSTFNLILDNSANNPNITVEGSFIFDLKSSGDITITDGATTVWDLQGDVVDQVIGGGTFSWNAVSGATILLGGANDQDIDFAGANVTDLTINKSAGTVTLSGDLDCESFDGIDGEIELGGRDLTTVNNCDWRANLTLGPLDLSAVVVGGDFTADGNTLPSLVDPWTLSVSGSAVASGAGSVQNSDARGGTRITATGWTDGGGNTNWSFGSPWYQYAQEAAVAG